MLLLSLFLAFSGPSFAQQRSTDTYVHLTSRMWETLDPANAFDAVSFILAGNVYEPLLAFKSADETDVFEPFLASTVPTTENGGISVDGRVYRFPIREGVRFHEGSKLTAEDVRYSLLRFMLLDPEGGPASLLLKPILGVYSTRDASGKIVVDFKQAAAAVKTDGNSVVVTLKHPDATFLKVLASLPIIVSKSWCASHDDWDGGAESWKKRNGRSGEAAGYLHGHMNGTGPFKLHRFDREERTITLHRFDGYWRNPAALRRIVFAAEPNGGLRLFMLETGDADAAFLEQPYRELAAKLPEIRIAQEGPSNKLGDLFFFNFKIEADDNELLGSGKLDGRGIQPDFFSDVEVRKAFAYAFNYERFFKEALASMGRRDAGPFPPDMVAGPGPVYDHDPKLAAEHFKKAWGGAAWDNGFVLPIAFSADNQTRQIAAEVMKDSLEKLNPKFKIRLHPVPPGRIYPEIERGRLPLFIGSQYADYPDPHSFAFGLLHSSGYYPKYQRYSSAEADGLIEEAVTQGDPAKRLAIYRKLEALAARDVPQLYTYSPLDLKACREGVLGIDTRANISNLTFNGFPYFYAYSKSK